MTPSAREAADDALALGRRGVNLCRRGRWSEGLEVLRRATDSPSVEALPGIVYAYLGWALALEKGHTRQGLSLCQYAVSAQPHEGDNYLALARLHLMLEQRERALGILNRGLAVASGHAGLMRCRLELGVRRAPVVRFLGRRHPLNRTLGRFRHRLRSARIGAW